MKVRVAEGVQALQFALKWRQRNFHRGGWALWQHLLTATPAAPLPGVKRTPSPDVSTKHKRLMQGQRLNPLPLHWTECTSILCQAPTAPRDEEVKAVLGRFLSQGFTALSPSQKQRGFDSPLREIHEHCRSLKRYRRKALRLTGWAILSPFTALWYLQRGTRAFYSHVEWSDSYKLRQV